MKWVLLVIFSMNCKVEVKLKRLLNQRKIRSVNIFITDMLSNSVFLQHSMVLPIQGQVMAATN